MTEAQKLNAPPARRTYALAGFAGVAGCLAAILGDAVTLTLRDGVSFVENSISRVAAGPHAIIADAGLSLFALGMLATAWALFDWDLGRLAYRLGAASLALCALVIFALAAVNTYDRKDAADFGFHMYLVYVFAALFPLAVLLVSSGLGQLGIAWKRGSRAVVGLWIAAGPIYFFVPNDVKGLFERATMLLPMLWLAALAILLIRRSLSRHSPPKP